VPPTGAAASASFETDREEQNDDADLSEQMKHLRRWIDEASSEGPRRTPANIAQNSRLSGRLISPKSLAKQNGRQHTEDMRYRCASGLRAATMVRAEFTASPSRRFRSI
jgi:hypothetical protein